MPTPRKTSKASQYLARLIRPRKLNNSDRQSIRPSLAFASLSRPAKAPGSTARRQGLRPQRVRPVAVRPRRALAETELDQKRDAEHRERHRDDQRDNARRVIGAGEAHHG